MVARFETGKYYKWIGPIDFNDRWTKEMDVWKDGKSRKCIQSRVDASTSFEGIQNNPWWYDHCLEHFAEVSQSGITLSDDSITSRKSRRAKIIKASLTVNKP